MKEENNKIAWFLQKTTVFEKIGQQYWVSYSAAASFGLRNASSQKGGNQKSITSREILPL